MKRITNALVAFVKLYLPNPFSLAITLSALVFAWAVLVTEHSAMAVIDFFGAGCFSNLAFIMQMTMILFAGYALAISPVIIKMLKALTSLPKTRTGALLFSFTVSYICGYLNWGFGLVAAALIAKEVAAKHHGKKLDFPIMVAAAYAASQVAALSSAVPLQISTPGHFLEKVIGVIPLSETLFASWNIMLTIVIWFVVSILLKFMNPSVDDSTELDYSVIQEEEAAAATLQEAGQKGDMSPAEKLDSFMPLSLFLAVLILCYCIRYFMKNGFMNLSTDIVIAIFLGLGILAHKTPIGYVRAVNEAIKTCAGIALLFPIYYGLMGMMRSSGLATTMSEWFVYFSTVETLPMYTFWSACLVNLFIPSGGGQWAVQGPVMMEAAVSLGASLPKTAMAVCWGDLCTNMIQPFWAIPVLAIAKLGVKDIMGYCFLIGAVEFVIISIVLVL